MLPPRAVNRCMEICARFAEANKGVIKRMDMRYQEEGFTIIELMVTVALVAILSVIAVPQFRAASNNSALRASTADLITAINLARSEAANLRADVTLSPIAGGDWASGWRIDYAPGVLAEPSEFRPRNGVKVVAIPNVPQLIFSATGVVNAASLFRICGGGGNGLIGREISVSRLGRIENIVVGC